MLTKLNYLRLIYFVLVWIVILILTLPLHLLGFIVIPLACLLKDYVRTNDNLSKPNDGAEYHFTSKFMWPWDNDTSDGIACRNYYQSSYKKYGYLDMIITTFVWSAIRNPINNWKRLLSPKYDFNKLKHIGSKEYNYKLNKPCQYLIWSGPFAGFYKSFMLYGEHRYIMIGYKLRPYKSDSEIPESQLNGTGMTFRIIPKKVN